MIPGESPGWNRSQSMVSSNSANQIIVGGQRYALSDDRLLAMPNLKESVLRFRRQVGKRDALVAAEEFGHLLQDLNLLTEKNNNLALPELENLLRLNPDLSVDLSPTNRFLSSEAEKRAGDKPDDRTVFYSREADIYLFVLDLFGKEKVPETMATKSGYRERFALHRAIYGDASPPK